ncbi:MAG: RNA 2',3'-cyclic phosphodiesterase [Nanopusillaceae archaeon]
MRIFIAIDLPEKIKDEIFNLGKKVRGINGKYVERENLHITLKFIGDIQPDFVERIKEVLKNVKYNKFYIRIEKFGMFNERVLWLGISKGFEDIINLHNLIDNELVKLKIERDYDFHPHITLYRIKGINNRKDLEESLKYLEKYRSEDIIVDKFYIKQSILRPQGPLYLNVEEYKLL